MALRPFIVATRTSDSSTCRAGKSPDATACCNRSKTAGTSSVVTHSATSTPARRLRSTASETPYRSEMAAMLDPDIVVMDISMAGLDGIAATRELTRRHSRARVLALTMHEEEAYLVPLLEAGAMGYVVKSDASKLLLDAVNTVAAGRRFVRPQAAQVLAEALAGRRAQDETRQRFESLSERERAVFKLMAQGYSSSQIGERLHISAKTVDTYRRRINEKLEIGERADYIRLALDMGLLTASEAAP